MSGIDVTAVEQAIAAVADTSVRSSLTKLLNNYVDALIELQQAAENKTGETNMAALREAVQTALDKLNNALINANINPIADNEYLSENTEPQPETNMPYVNTPYTENSEERKTGTVPNRTL